jgi:hypothetical protein
MYVCVCVCVCLFCHSSLFKLVIRLLGQRLIENRTEMNWELNCHYGMWGRWKNYGECWKHGRRRWYEKKERCKVVLCLFMHHALKTYGGVELQPHVFLSRHHYVQATSWRGDYVGGTAELLRACAVRLFCTADIGPPNFVTVLCLYKFLTTAFCFTWISVIFLCVDVDVTARTRVPL